METTENVDGRKYQVTKKIFTLANIFSFSRILVAIPLIWIYEYYDGVSWIFTTLIAYAIISDYLDGWAARGRNEISELGKVIDPIADKVLAGVLFIFAAYLGKIPLWFLFASLGRDLLIMVGSLYIRFTRGKVAMSVMSGKVFVNALALYWIVAFYFPQHTGLVTFFLVGTTVLMIVSFADYVYRFVRILRGAEFN
ncbi:MAG: CDP-alcohol phosphatidyltransferase family protein [Bacteroidetes bacterium]|nr:CDP-alcohol phosphatidyltransferase family protein [Bacteroidota bacterium]MCH8523188.1 CDP-alcohol phosphatidyltransferase family protein [Balneolales bacterium]